MMDDTGSSAWASSISSEASSLSSAVRQDTDIVMEFAGHPQAFNEGLDLIRRGGRYVVVGQLGSGTATFRPSLIVAKQLKILGSLSGRAKAYWKALEFISAHRNSIPFERIISNRYPLDQVNLALERMKRYEEIKPVILPPTL